MKCLYGKYEYAIAKVAKQKQSIHNKYYSRCKCVVVEQKMQVC